VTPCSAVWSGGSRRARDGPAAGAGGEPSATTRRVERSRARNVLLATGGSGQLFAITTNPTEATGDGLAMALRAGVAAPTWSSSSSTPPPSHHPRMPRPLLSEALRGHGALLRDATGERFVDELLPRDVVSRRSPPGCSSRRRPRLARRHRPRLRGALPDHRRRPGGRRARPGHRLAAGRPGGPLHCGGVITDLDGATSLPGLWAAGEVTCTGVHGANRLASNSLLEGMVFGPRAVEAIARGADGPDATGAMRPSPGRRAGAATPAATTPTSPPGRR
jgi:L-aspartate oxidase